MDEPAGASVLGTPDIRSLADLRSGFEIVHSMRIILYPTRLALMLAIAVSLPMLPLVLTEVPLMVLVTRRGAMLGGVPR
ncbi:hypothetical protein WME88_51740 [Sorangium sp. So ce216]